MRLPVIALILVVFILFVVFCLPLFSIPVVRTPSLTANLPATTQLGRVVTAGNGGLVISDAAGFEHSFPVYQDAPIYVNGQNIALDDLPHGTSVRVAVRRTGEVMAVSAVRIPMSEVRWIFP